MPQVEVRVDGQDVAGWQEVELVFQLDALAASFSLALSGRLSNVPPPVTFEEGQACEVLYDGQPLVTGWIDDVADSDTASSASLAVSGRSKAGDLVDCSAIHVGSWRNLPALTVAQELAAPFGVQVVADLPLPDVGRFTLQEGETAFEALARLAADHGVRAVSDTRGRIHLVKTGVERVLTRLERGWNIASGSRRRSMAERFSDYIVKAQFAGDDELNGAAAASPKWVVKDDGVPRYRPHVLHSDQPRDAFGRFKEGKREPSTLERKALWERNTRAGKALELSYTVVDPLDKAASWEHAAGVWQPNTLVHVIDPWRDIDAELLLTSVRLTRSAEAPGTQAELTLTHPEAYDILKPPTKRKKGKTYAW